jgi:hypothetical protein
MKKLIIFILIISASRLTAQNYFKLNKIIDLGDIGNKNFFKYKIEDNKVCYLYIQGKVLDSVFLEIHNMKSDSVILWSIPINITISEGVTDFYIYQSNLAILTRERIFIYNLITHQINISREKKISYFNFDKIYYEGNEIYLIKQTIHNRPTEHRYAFQKFNFHNNIASEISEMVTFDDYPNSTIDFLGRYNYVAINKSSICLINQFQKSITVIDKGFHYIKNIQLNLDGWDTSRLDTLNYFALEYNIKSTSKALEIVMSYIDVVSYLSKVDFINDSLLVCEANLKDSANSFDNKTFLLNVKTGGITFINDIENLRFLNMKANVSYSNYPIYLSGSYISCNNGQVLIFRKNTLAPNMGGELLKDYFQKRNFVRNSFFEILEFNQKVD